MPSTYTTNNGIELIATGEQSGTWGSTTNTNLQLLDASLDGQVTVTLAATGTSGSPNTLPISDGSASNGRNRLVIFNDGTDLGGTAYVQLTPNDAEKIVYVRNSLSGSRSILLFQGTYNASNDYEVPAGTTAVVFFDGAGTGAVAANVFDNAHFDALNIVGNASVGGTLSVTGTSTFNDDVTFVGNTNNIVIDKSADSMIFQDASRMIFGTGSDLLIEHSGAFTESRIWNYGGNLSIAQQVNDEDVDILSDDGSGGTASYFRADGSTGEAMLFHYGSEKLATKSTGIDVTGTVTDDGATHDGDVTFTGASYNVVWDKSDNQFEFATNAKIKFGLFTELYDNGAATFMVDQTPIMKVQYDTAGTGGPSFFLNHKKTTPADGDTSGNIYFSLEGVDTALITSTQPDVTTATSSGNLIFKVREDNSTVTYMTIDGEGENITMAKPLAVTGNVNVTGTVTDDGATHDGDVTFTGANYNVVWDKSDDALEFADNAKAVFGTSADYAIYNDGDATDEQLLFEEISGAAGSFVFKGNLLNLIGPTLEIAHGVTAGGNNNVPGLITINTKDAGGTGIAAFTIGTTLVDSTSGASTTKATFYVKEDGNASAQAYLVLNGDAEQIDVSKNIVSTADITAVNFNTTSDASLKTNISTFANPLDTINSLRGVAFDWINNGKSEIGVIAQEVEKVLPELVSTNKEGIKSVKYGNLIAVLIEAVKDQQSQINELKSKLS
jgi:hypothetical protein